MLVQTSTNNTHVVFSKPHFTCSTAKEFVMRLEGAQKYNCLAEAAFFPTLCRDLLKKQEMGKEAVRVMDVT